ncbi:hypothetical protein M758_9G185400 [Ceratodon purpureus]|uniref:DUF676 domain-containing protein n=1 Tax=Ceratodon purpureus TaxID=3225 RepID=A0A8T0GXJ2_CERPU|nr:hypothetical protein KC19_9G187700 [Ceratodon purpureus]KAG0607009.1 hypothetical protein M758_9G185400 [Ceratodon purpureus]
MASLFKGLFGSGEGGSSSIPAPPDGIKKFSDSVYILSEPAGDSPEMEIVFIHGLQLSDYREAYWKTWVTSGKKEKDGKEVCWPVTWLGKEFPRARILSLCYDSSALKSSTTGNMDGYILGESLVQEMVVMAKVGQQSDCPIVFVCHSLGGIVVKSIVLQADARKSGKSDGPKYAKFLQNIRGFHYYATPHDGSKLADLASYLPKMGKMVKELEVINDGLGRLNGRFEQLEKDHFANKWEFSVIAEAHKTVYKGFSKKVVEEASARHGHDRFKVVMADHFGVCKPDDKISNSYQVLTGFISEVVTKQNSSLTRVTPAMVQTLEHEEDLT